MMKRPLRASLVVLALAAACGQPAKQDSDAEFLSRLTALCGQAFEGEIVSKDPEDDAWRTERIVMHVRIVPVSYTHLTLPTKRIV